MPLSGLLAPLTKAQFLCPSKGATMSFGIVMVTLVDCLAHGAMTCLWILVKIWSCAVAKSHTIKIQRVKHGRPTRPLCKHAIVLPVEALSCCCFLDINMPSSRLSDKNKRPVNIYRPLISYCFTQQYITTQSLIAFVPHLFKAPLRPAQMPD